MKKYFVLLSFLIYLIPPPSLNSQIFQNWSARYNGTGNGTDEVNAMATDVFGNVFVTGASWGNGWDCATIKYNKCGILRWVNRYDAGIHDEGKDITVNTSNEILVGGESFSNVSFFNFQYLVVKYGNLGNQIWVVRDGPYYENLFEKVALDNNNNIYLAGTTNENGGPFHYFYDFVLMKMAPNGITLWTRYYGLSNKDEFIEDLTIGSDGYELPPIL